METGNDNITCHDASHKMMNISGSGTYRKLTNIRFITGSELNIQCPSSRFTGWPRPLITLDCQWRTGS